MFSIFIPTASPAAIPINVPSGPAAEPATVVPVFTASFVPSLVTSFVVSLATFLDVFFATFFDAFLADFLASSFPLADAFFLILLPATSFCSFVVLTFFLIRLPSFATLFRGLIAIPVTSKASSMFSPPSILSNIFDSATFLIVLVLFFILVDIDLLSIFASRFL